jgi:hypothetical protein
VETITAVLSPGWRERLVPVICEQVDPVVVGWCLEPNDLWVAKAAAGREKDNDYCRALAHAGLVGHATCLSRAEALEEPERSRALALARAAFR